MLNVITIKPIQRTINPVTKIPSIFTKQTTRTNINISSRTNGISNGNSLIKQRKPTKRSRLPERTNPIHKQSKHKSNDQQREHLRRQTKPDLKMRGPALLQGNKKQHKTSLKTVATARPNLQQPVLHLQIAQPTQRRLIRLINFFINIINFAE